MFDIKNFGDFAQNKFMIESQEKVNHTHRLSTLNVDFALFLDICVGVRPTTRGGDTHEA